MKYALLFLAMTISAPVFAAPGIVCKEISLDDETFEEKNQGTYIAELDATGKVSKLSVQREATESSPAIRAVFTRENSKLVHEVRKNAVEYVDEETGETVYQWNIEDVETIEASDAAGNVLTISVNDSLYSGHVVSSLLFRFGGKEESANGPSVTCDGDVKFRKQ